MAVIAVLAGVVPVAAARPAHAGTEPVVPSTTPIPVDADRDRDQVADALEATVRGDPTGSVDVIVRLEPGADPDAVARAAGTDPADAIRLDLIDAVAFTVPADEVADLATLRGVGFVAEDVEVAIAPVAAGDTGAVANTDGGAAMGVPAARLQAGVTGDRDGDPAVASPADVVVAVLDTGIDVTHVDLDGAKLVPGGWFDAVNGRAAPYDDHGHGSHVAGTIAGTGEGNPALAGMAPGAGLVGVKVLAADGTGTMSRVVAGLDWVVANRVALGVEVANLSLGFPSCSNGTDSLSQAVNAAVAAGVVVVAAAGNRGPGRCTVGSPATAAGTISVGAVAVRPGGTAATGSAYASRGPTGDGRTGVDLLAPGNVTSIDARPLTSPPPSRSGYLARTGTSMASAMVSGVVALLLDRTPTLTPGQVRATLRATAVDWGDLGVDTDTGAGMVDAWAALGSVGPPPFRPRHGRLRAYVPPGGSLVVPVTVTPGAQLGVTLTHDYDDASSTATDLDLTVRNPGGAVLGSSSSSARVESVGVAPGGGAVEVVVTAAAGGGTFVLDIDGTPVVPPAAPPAPAVTATSGADRITVAWSPTGGDPFAYVVTGPAGPVATVAGTVRSLTFSGLPDGTVATYQVQAVNLAGTGPAAAATATVSRIHPFATPEAFVAQQYRDFLLREPDPGGLAYWSDLLRSGATGTAVVGSFLSSAEYEGRVASLARLYFAYFLRPPDPGGLQFWLEQRNAGRPLDWISGFFSQSPEFLQRYGALDEVAFVRLVYTNVLGREPDFLGLLFWVDALRTGRMDRGRVMLEFSESAEYRATSRGEVDTTLVWFGLLRDMPSTAEYAEWIPAIDRGTDRLVLVDALLRDPRYAARFGS